MRSGRTETSNGFDSGVAPAPRAGDAGSTQARARAQRSPNPGRPMDELTPTERRLRIAMRPWRPEESVVVWRGATGRFIVALEPAALSLLFALFALGIAHLADNKD